MAVSWCSDLEYGWLFHQTRWVIFISEVLTWWSSWMEPWKRWILKFGILDFFFDCYIWKSSKFTIQSLIHLYNASVFSQVGHETMEISNYYRQYQHSSVGNETICGYGTIQISINFNVMLTDILCLLLNVFSVCDLHNCAL